MPATESTKKSGRLTADNNEPGTLDSLFRRICLLLLAALLIGQSSGCAMHYAFEGFREEMVISYRDAVWAKRAFNLRYGNCDRQFRDHFENGFIEGYCAVSEGGDGYVPAMAPENYMGYEYQSAEGSLLVNSWFEGFPLGAAAARQDGAGSFRDVYISNMIDSAINKNNKRDNQPQLDSKPNPDVGINPELKLDAPPKPVAGTDKFKTTLVGPSVLKFSRLEPMKTAVDPSVNATKQPDIEESRSVRTAATSVPTILR